MPLIVQKFGGSSVANAKRVLRAADRAIQAKKAGNQVIVVVSARGDTTDELIDLAKEITENPPARELDMLLSTGEQISIALLAMAIQSRGEQAVSFTGAQVGIVTDSTHTKARIKSISTERMRQALNGGKIVIVAGFQGIDEQENITTLGRGGSDTTAVALAAVMKKDQAGDGRVGCEIYTDVDGVFTTDPRIVPEACKLDTISYEEMLELASLGAGVMHSRSIEFAKKFDVPLQVRSSLSDGPGTWIVPEERWMREPMICGAAIVKDEARVSIDGVPDKPGISREIFNAIADQNIVVDMIVQNVGTAGKASIGFTVPSGELQGTLAVLNRLAKPWGAQVVFEKDVSKVSIVGVGMQDHTGVAQKMFAALAAAGINLKMITTGDIKISVLVAKSDGVEALRAVHRAFELGKPRPGSAASTSAATHAAQRAAPGDSSRDIVALAQKLDSMEDILVSDVQLNTDQGRITIFQLPDRPGICSQVFHAVAGAGIIVDMIVQNLTGAGQAGLSFSVPKDSIDRALEVTRRAAQALDPSTDVGKEDGIARLIVRGVGMRTHTGVARRMFGALADRGINISMINTSEVSLSVVVDGRRGAEAQTVLKAAFGIP